MAKKYGGLTGTKVSPTSTSAPGVWVLGSEVYREKTSNTWPLTIPADAQISLVGSYALATSSGVVDTALASTFFILASGAVLSRSAYPDLCAVLASTYPGDGVSTFGTPNLFDKFIYFKGTTTSGTLPLVGSGIVGSTHNHTFTAYTGSNSSANTTASQRLAFGSSQALTSSYEGSENCEMRKRECIPLLSTIDATLPVGVAFPVLWPNASTPLPSFDTTRMLIASGQDISRASYSTLYSILGNLYGSGNGSTTFTLPDYRGIFLSGSRQPPTVKQPSGTISPSGFLIDSFARHAHTFTGGAANTVNGDGGNGTVYGNLSIAPASSSYAGNPTENRSANISVIWFLVTN